MHRFYLFIFSLLLAIPAFSQQSHEIWRDETASIDERVENLLSLMTTAEKISLLKDTSPAIPRLGIDKYNHGNEALHGIIRPGRFTVFPQAIALAAMWDDQLLERVSTAISDEARGKWNSLHQGKDQKDLYSDLLTFWSPTVNMARDPRWGRTPETYGEDPFLTGAMGSAFVKGLQGNDPRYLKCVSTPKHFAANNEEHNRFSCVALISEKQLREYYLPGYEACVKEGHAASIMGSYTAINNIPSCCSPWLLTKVLREDWGFDGYVVSDCGGVANIMNAHHFVKRPETAAALAIKAGLDLECGCYIYVEPLMKAYEMGMVDDADINRAAGRILRARFKLGIFDSGKDNPYTKIDPSVVGCQKHQDLALETAKKSIVLLKNENKTLPLNANKIKSIAIVGNNAAKCVLGDYSGMPTVEPVSVLSAVQSRVGKKIKINYVPWKSAKDETDFVDEKYFSDGLKAQYYKGRNFDSLVMERNEKMIYLEPQNQAPDPVIPNYDFSVRWTGKLKPETTGEYIFNLTNSGKTSFLIDGKKVENDTNYLEAGKEYDIMIETSHHRAISALVQLKWKKPDSSKDIFEDAVNAASKSEVVVAVMGINRNYECEGRDRTYLGLPEEQVDFLKEIYKYNKNIVLVLVAGSSMSINWENENLPAIIDAWYGGEYGGTAIVDVLFGDYNPAGRLPLTFYKGMEQLPAFDDYDISKGRTYKYFKDEPLYPFGYGLSYTSFQYDSLKVSESDEGITVNFNVKNTGKMDGDEVAQVYVKLKDYESEPPIKELKGFKRLSINHGKTAKCSIFIPKSQLRYWSDKEHKFKYTTSIPEIFVGSSSSDIRLHR